MNDEVKERVVTFRVTEEQYLRIEDCGFNAGSSPNEWCRYLAVSESSDDFGMTANERMLIEEMGVLRKILGVVASHILTPEEMEALRKIVDENYEKYGRDLLAKRAAGRPEGEIEEAPGREQ